MGGSIVTILAELSEGNSNLSELCQVITDVITKELNQFHQQFGIRVQPIAIENSVTSPENSHYSERDPRNDVLCRTKARPPSHFNSAVATIVCNRIYINTDCIIIPFRRNTRHSISGVPMKVIGLK